jgi:hypothetical protein
MHLTFWKKRHAAEHVATFHGVDADKRGTNSIEQCFHVSTTILRFVVASAAEAELGALYHNCQTGIIFRLTLADMGHPQPKPQCIAIMQLRWASRTIQLNASILDQWK